MSDKPKRLRFSLGAVLWMLAIAAVALGWAVDHRRLSQEVATLRDSVVRVQLEALKALKEAQP